MSGFDVNALKGETLQWLLLFLHIRVAAMKVGQLVGVKYLAST